MADAAVREPCRCLPALPHVGHYQTRNRGTLGGSVAHADPSAEIPLVLATSAAKSNCERRAGRRVKASQFFRSALVTAREPDELLTALYWPRRKTAQRSAFVEFAVREGDFAIVAVACTLDAGTLRFGFRWLRRDAPRLLSVQALTTSTPQQSRPLHARRPPGLHAKAICWRRRTTVANLRGTGVQSDVRTSARDGPCLRSPPAKSHDPFHAQR